MTTVPEGWTELGPGKTYPVLPFFVAVFASWVLWIPAGARAAGVLPFAWPFELAWLGVFSPLAFGVYFTIRAGGRAGLISYLARFAQWRFSVLYWAYALAAMPMAGLLTIAVMSAIDEPVRFSDGAQRLVSGQAQELLMSRYAALNYESVGFFDRLFREMRTSTSVFIAGFSTLALVDGGLSEEPGWRGYAYPVLQDRWGALPAAVTVGLAWALWHMGPLQWQILFAEGLPAFFAFLPGYALVYTLVVPPLAIVFAWLYECTHGSLLICIVTHAAYNVTVSVAGVLFPMWPIAHGIVVCLWMTAAAIIVRRGWRHLAESRGPL